VQHRDRTDLSTQMSRFGGDIAHRLGCGAEQAGVDHALVLEGDLRRRHRQGDDDMEVRHWQQLCLARFEPLGTRQALALRQCRLRHLGTSSRCACVVRTANQSAIAALFDVPAESRRPGRLRSPP
jgi:hypothetical protein